QEDFDDLKANVDDKRKEYNQDISEIESRMADMRSKYIACRDKDSEKIKADKAKADAQPLQKLGEEVSQDLAACTLYARLIATGKTLSPPAFCTDGSLTKLKDSLDKIDRNLASTDPKYQTTM